jgi:SAM-dependent methyltransferase
MPPHSHDVPDDIVEELRSRTVQRYSGLARLAQAGGTPLDSDPDTFTDGCFGAAAYTDDAPEPALRASLGCGNPLTVADLRPGETVLDLGSGGGLDVLLSARRVGPTGHAYGLDASPDMLDLARSNATEAGATNVDFLHGTIEDIPLADNSIDVIISNCVINLSIDKARVLTEAHRVLRPGGRLGISDVISDEGLDPHQRTDAEERIGCSNGTLTPTQYRHLLTAAGFTDLRITTTNNTGGGLHSATVQATKSRTAWRSAT